MTHENCPHCGASMKKYWHKLTPGLVKTLVKVYKAVLEKGENIVNKDDLNLSHSEYGNFQKLRFHGLIAKYRVDGKWKRGTWVITARAGAFLKGYKAVPYRVQTFRNKIVGRDIKKVTVDQVTDIKPYFESYEDFRNQMEFTVFPDTDVDAPIIKEMKKRGKKYFCSCGGQVKRKILFDRIVEENTARMKEITICIKCGEDYSDANVKV